MPPLLGSSDDVSHSQAAGARCLECMEGCSLVAVGLELGFLLLKGAGLLGGLGACRGGEGMCLLSWGGCRCVAVLRGLLLVLRECRAKGLLPLVWLC